MSRIKIEFNPKIVEILKRSNISLDDGISYLLSAYYKFDPSYIPEELKRKVLSTGILTRDYNTNEVKWKVPLFEGGVTNFEWVVDFMDMFSRVNPSRRGVKSIAITRMKTFFVNNPSVRMQDVMEATELYIKSVDDPQYLMKSHKFIYTQDGSTLEEWIHILNDSKTSEKGVSYKRKMM